MKTAKQTTRLAQQLFRLCLVNGLMDEDRVRRVVELVIERKRRGYLNLLARFRRLVKVNLDRHTAHVQSAEPLPPDLRTRVQTGVERDYGPGIGIFFADRPDLIGGMRIQVGSSVHDGSVRSALSTLEKSF